MNETRERGHKMNITSKKFGVTSKQEEVTQYTLTNAHGCSVSILNYGGIITEIMVPDAKGTMENVVLGFDNMKDYEEKSPYFGCITGRIAGRITASKFTIDGTTYEVASNDGKNNLHGGVVGFDKVMWNATEVKAENAVGLSLNYLSKDGEEGFPGNLDVNVTYTFTNNNDLEISYSATTDKKTLVNLTNHTYFNLSGNTKKDVLTQTLQFDADQFGAVNDEIMPAGIVDVEGTPFDFRQAKPVGQNIKDDDIQLKNTSGGYDHPMLLNHKEDIAVVMADPESGRRMEMTTDQKVVVFYSGNLLEEDMTLSSGVKTTKHMGLCLEAQYYPDHMNQDCFPDKFLEPGDVYRQKTVYHFGTC